MRRNALPLSLQRPNRRNTRYRFQSLQQLCVVRSVWPRSQSNGLNDPQIIGLAKTVEIVEDDAFNDAFPARRFARTHFHLQDGRILSSRDTEAQGDPENKVPDQVIWDKLRGLASPLLGKAWSEQFLSLAWGIVDAPSVTPLFELIAQTAQTKDLK